MGSVSFHTFRFYSLPTCSDYLRPNMHVRAAMFNYMYRKHAYATVQGGCKRATDKGFIQCAAIACCIARQSASVQGGCKRSTDKGFIQRAALAHCIARQNA